MNTDNHSGGWCGHLHTNNQQALACKAATMNTSKQRVTVADQIEISLRTGNREKQAKLDSINAQCEFVMANSDNVGLKQFAAIIQGITNQIP